MPAHVQRIVDEFDPDSKKTRATSMDEGAKFTKSAVEKPDVGLRQRYQSGNGSVMFPMIMIRPDIPYPVGKLLRYA